MENRDTTSVGQPTAKVAFRLVRDEDGYPPADWEHLWAHSLGESLFVLDNTPFFARGASVGDVVLAEQSEGLNQFRRVVRPSLHSTLRVILFRQELADELRSQLRQLGCKSEQSHLPGLIAVDVPEPSLLGPVRDLLESGEVAGDWTYEEAAIR